MTGTAEQPWYLYMVRCRDGSIYVGVALDAVRRFQEHSGQGPKCAKYLRGRGPLQLICLFLLPTKREAMQLEYRLKRKSKKYKEAVVAGQIPLADVLACP